MFTRGWVLLRFFLQALTKKIPTQQVHPFLLFSSDDSRETNTDHRKVLLSVPVGNDKQHRFHFRECQLLRGNLHLVNGSQLAEQELCTRLDLRPILNTTLATQKARGIDTEGGGEISFSASWSVKSSRYKSDSVATKVSINRCLKFKTRPWAVGEVTFTPVTA